MTHEMDETDNDGLVDMSCHAGVWASSLRACPANERGLYCEHLIIRTGRGLASARRNLRFPRHAWSFLRV